MEKANLVKNSEKTLENGGFSFAKALQSLLESFPKRSQDIVAERYGISGEEEKTLEEIGDNFHVTRERVRQIIREVVRKIKEKSDNQLLEEAKEKIVWTIQGKSGIIKEDELFSALSFGRTGEKGAIGFFVELSDQIRKEKDLQEIVPSFALANFKIEEWRKVKNSAKDILKAEKKLLGEKELLEKMIAKESISAKKLFDYLGVSAEVKKNKFGNWGLAESEEVTPKGTREKAYLVLKENGKPVHFRDISALIDKFNLNKKKTNPQTVHNELIKDDRFVLVGRGIYALKEWGYQDGTVKDVLENILKQESTPMKKEEILKRLMKMRQVKKSTIVINLNNFFTRVGKDEYTIKK
jgi:DNA-directed RNA polymerase delta subunit